MTFNDYFQSYENYFWQWEEQMEIIAIPGENTIAYRELVIDIFEKISPQGVPPFGSLLLAIIATNPKGSSSIDAVNMILLRSLKPADHHTLAQAIAFLKLLSEVPDKYKKGKMRILLLQALFEQCHNILSAKNAKALRDGYHRNKHGEGVISTKKPFHELVFTKDFRTIGLLALKFRSVNDIIEKIASLPDFEEQLELEKVNEGEEESIDLIQQLVDNTKTFHVGSLVKRIWSGLNIPVHSELPSEQPLGGVSDLTNKGDFDKLLISEFANEDIVFLSRLANNEALYIHREIPPAANNMQRVILIDISLKSWGTPKAIAFATMIAIAKHPKTNFECSAYVIGNTYHEVSIESIDTIIEGLQLLEGSLHSGKGLEAFFKDHPADKNRELFIITEPSTLKQVGMLKVMNEYHSYLNYWIYVNSEGDIDIFKKQQNSKKHIQHIRLPLEELWKKEIKKDHKPQKRNESASEYPLLFRNSINLKQMLSTSNGEIYQVTSDRGLLRFYDRSEKQHTKGWEMLYEQLPFSGGEFEIGLLNNGERVLLMFNPQTKEITILNIDNQDKLSFPFNEWKSTGHPNFLFRDNMFYHMNNKGTVRISLSGEISQEDTPMKDAFEQRRKELQAIRQEHSYQQNYFKNVNEVFVNEENNLVLNIHQLYINKSYHIKLDTTNHRAKKRKATRQNDKEFVFEDGSIVEINRNGILILKSSNDSIPWIYVPLVLDSSLGVATENDFAGNEYYYKNPQFEVKLVSAGPKTISAIRILKENLPIGLSEAKTIADAAPTLITNRISEKQAMKLKSDLRDVAAVAELQVAKDEFSYPVKITSADFFSRYIEQFINTILIHGTKN
jgi:ribosomal protein L7/L12